LRCAAESTNNSWTDLIHELGALNLILEVLILPAIWFVRLGDKSKAPPDRRGGLCHCVANH
jgi:hypothetical protein